MSDIKAVTIQKINLGGAILRKYSVEYFSGVSRTYGVPPETVEKFIKENRREFSKVKYEFKDGGNYNG
ncbi:MAG: hypothetical protein J6Y64_06285 [Ruminococcus sp.]|nr:hypothetical protein [Ruminococcus sp.]